MGLNVETKPDDFKVEVKTETRKVRPGFEPLEDLARFIEYNDKFVAEFSKPKHFWDRWALIFR